MVTVERGNVGDFFREEPTGREVYDKVASLVDRIGPADVRVSKSQVAFRRRRGFCWLWLPAMYLRAPTTPVVVSLALSRHDGSPRWKQAVEVGGHWMHHLEVRDAHELDDEFADWLAEAYAGAG